MPSPLDRFARLLTKRAVTDAALAPTTPATKPIYGGDRLLRDTLLAGGLGLGAGAGLAGLRGLYNVIRRNIEESKRPKYPSPQLTPVPYPVTGMDEDEENAKPLRRKVAATWYNKLMDIPGYVPSVMGAGLLGTMGGLKVVNHLLDKQREQQRAKELEEAETEFEQALVGSYQRPRRPMKLASDLSPGQKLSCQLDDLYDRVTKNAGWLSEFGNIYGAYALPTALLSAGWAYNKARSHNPRKIIDDAVKQRLRRAYANRPSEMLTVPLPVEKGENPEEVEDTANGESAVFATPPHRRLLG